jgi:hypothetical protein
MDAGAALHLSRFLVRPPDSRRPAKLSESLRTAKGPLRICEFMAEGLRGGLFKSPGPCVFEL